MEHSKVVGTTIMLRARITIDPYISREECLYTEPHSVILGKPLTEKDVWMVQTRTHWHLISTQKEDPGD